MNVAAIDFVFAGLVILFTLRVAVRGFVGGVMSLAAAVFGLLSAIFLFRAVGEFIRERFMPSAAAAPEIIAFVALFMLVFVVAKILESMLRGVIEGLGLEGLDRVLGAVLGFAQGLVAVCAVLLLIRAQPFFDSGAVLENSFFARTLLPFIEGFERGLPGVVARAETPLGGFTCSRTS